MNRFVPVVVVVAVAGGVAALEWRSERKMIAFDRLCRENARVIVHDRALWAHHRERAAFVLAQRKASFGPDSDAGIPEFVDGFAEAYGQSLNRERTSRDGRFVRDDVFVLHDGRRVAQLVDYTWFDKGFTGPSNFTCIGLHPELYRAATAA